MCILQKSTFCVVTFILWLSSLHSISLDDFLRKVNPAAHHGKYNLAIRPCLNANEIASCKFQVTCINRCQDLPFLGHVDKWIHKLFPTGHHLFHGQGDPTCLLEKIQQFSLKLKKEISCEYYTTWRHVRNV